jgi:hypothetical protein
MDVLEGAVLDGLQRHLMNDDHLEVFCHEYTRHLDQLRMEASGNRSRDEARLVKIGGELDRLVEAIVHGVPADRVRDKMAALDRERVEIEAGVAAQNKEIPPQLHPKMGEIYRHQVACLRETLASGSNRAEIIDRIRADRSDRAAPCPCGGDGVRNGHRGGSGRDPRAKPSAAKQEGRRAIA